MESSTQEASAASAPPAGEAIVSIRDCTKTNFLEQSNHFIERVPKASWIAIDEEMTGIQLPQRVKLVKDESPAERYPQIKKVSERYSIIQLGISLFEEDLENPGKFHVYRYKFTLFPPDDSELTREVVLSPSSVKFLVCDNNCNLNEWIKEGIPFSNGAASKRLLEEFREKELEKKEKEGTPPTVSPLNSRRRVELKRFEDRDFHSRCMASLRQWLDSPSDPNPGDLEGTSLLLPPCNGFLRRALYESINSNYGNLLVLETIRESNQIKIWRLTAAERERRNIRLRSEGFGSLLTEKVGVWRIFLALSLACNGKGPTSQAEHMALSANVDDALKDWNDIEGQKVRRKIPLIVHNGLQDLLFLLTHFHNQTLPETWSECKSLIHSLFPVIYDTKIMTTEYYNDYRGRTDLGSLYDFALLEKPLWKRCSFANNSSVNEEQLHDAGYDSHCTGVVFHALASLIHRKCQHQDIESHFALWDTNPQDDDIAWQYGRNKMYFHFGAFSIDFEQPTHDPLTRGMSRLSTFRVDEIDSSVNTRDIVQCLSGVTDSTGRPVNYEIIWVNDVRFLVGAMSVSKDNGHHDEYGKLISSALKNRFTSAKIEPFAQLEDNKKHAPSLWNLWGLFGNEPIVNNGQEDDFSRSLKRRRLE